MHPMIKGNTRENKRLYKQFKYAVEDMIREEGRKANLPFPIYYSAAVIIAAELMAERPWLMSQFRSKYDKGNEIVR